MTLGLVLLAACGGDDDEAAESDPPTDESGGGSAGADEYVEALATTYQTDTGDGFLLDEDQATCTATGLVDAVGADALDAAGVTPQELASAEELGSLDVELADSAATDIGRTFAECEVAELLVPLIVDGFVAGIGAEVSADGTTCLIDNIDATAMGDAFAQAFVDVSDDGDVETEILSALGACPTVTTELIVTALGVEVTPEARACIETWVTDHPEQASGAFASDNPAAAEEVGLELGAACPEVFL